MPRNPQPPREKDNGLTPLKQVLNLKNKQISQLRFRSVSRQRIQKENESLALDQTRSKAEQMDTTSRLSRLVVVLLFLACFVAVASTSTPIQRPGFLYTRTIGRCTPQFWSSRREAWPRMVPQTSTLSKVFGSRVYERFRSDLTLLESTTRNDEHENAFAGLVKEATAALLNSYARDGYPYSAWEVKTLLIQALVSEKAATRQAQKFSIANQACR